MLVHWVGFFFWIRKFGLVIFWIKKVKRRLDSDGKENETRLLIDLHFMGTFETL